MIPMLYDCFKHWAETGSVYLISDPHFDDADCHFMNPNWPTPQEYIDKINSIVKKNDTLICLGDCGNIEWFKKIKAGYKVLVKGNHDDKGDAYYKKKITKVTYDADTMNRKELLAKLKEEYPDCSYTIFENYDFHMPFHRYVVVIDNGLFDEVYAGPLWIAPKILLSHEPIDLPFVLDIHGHCHGDKFVFGGKADGMTMNIAADVIGWQPVSLGILIKQGVTAVVKDIHRVTIDRAGEK